MAHPFICPNCGHRTSELDRNAGFSRNRKGCSKCGFAFLFELLDDYYPAPDAAFFVCDGEEAVIGRRVDEVLGLQFTNGNDPLGTVIEWGVRALEVPVTVSGEREIMARATADLFRDYEEDGGL